jgi:hypothetical protein
MDISVVHPSRKKKKNTSDKKKEKGKKVTMVTQE